MLVLIMLRAVLVWQFHLRAPAPHAIKPLAVLVFPGALREGNYWGGAGMVLFPVTSFLRIMFLSSLSW